MDMLLHDSEVRILGCLVEKEMTTPEYYPLTLNALLNACNQKSNRNPAVTYDETVVEQGLKGLQEKGLARETHAAGSRVPKYLHTILDRFDLTGQEMALLCELMLRGPQTVGELRARAERMSAFESLEAVENTLQGLAEHAPQLAVKLQREPGRKECRYAHLLSGNVFAERPDQGAETAVPAGERIARLEEEIRRIREELEGMKQAFEAFRSQF